MLNKSSKTTKKEDHFIEKETRLMKLYKIIEMEKENTIKYIRQIFPSISVFITSFITDFYDRSVISLKFYLYTHLFFSIEIKVEKINTNEETNTEIENPMKEIILVPTGITTSVINITSFNTITQKVNKITEYNFSFSYLEYKIYKNDEIETRITEYLKLLYNRMKECFETAPAPPTEEIKNINN